MKDSQIKIGLRVRVEKLGNTKGMMINQKHLDVRQQGVIGVITGYVPGHGGDVLWVLHEDKSVGAYSYTELEPEKGLM